MFNFKAGIIFLCFVLTSISLTAQNSKITGKVIDAKSGEELIGANVLVLEMEAVGAAANENGEFSISVPVGSYSIRASLVGYTPMVKTDVIVRAGSDAFVLVKLSETTLEIDQVVVQADYFNKSIIENDLSTLSLESEEIKRSPGSMQDFQRILQAMAGVSFSNDQNNELLVRGGSPNENLTVLDNMEIHSTNHYPNDYNSGGPINMVNTDLIQDIQFSTGGFVSKYGDKLSSVMNIESREGSRKHLFKSNLNLSMAGAGAVIEGSINNGEGSWIVSARKSYIDLIAGAVGLTAIPKYYDLQWKAVYDLSKKHKLSWTGIYGNDRIDIKGESEVTKTEMAGLADSVDVRNVDVKQSQYATGLSLKSLWNKNFYSLITIYNNQYNSVVSVNGEYTQRFFNADGKVEDTDVLSTRRIYDVDASNSVTAVKADLVYNISRTNELSFGAALKFGHVKSVENIDTDTVRYDVNQDGFFDQTVTLPESHLNYDINLGDENKSHIYVNNRMKLFDESLVLNTGLRYDYFTYSGRGNLSPRFSLSYALVPQLTHLNFAYGEYYQTQSYPTYGDRYQSYINQNLKNTHARHFVLGLDHIFDTGLKASLEVYHKTYNSIPVREDFVNFYDRTFRSEKKLNIGKQTVYGIDLQVQQKLIDDFYGTLAFSRMWSKVDDPRIGNEGQTYSSDYEFPYVLTLIVGKRFSNLRKKLDGMNPVIKYATYILPFSDDMEISLRWRYASGKPYTPMNYVTYEQHRIGDTKWSDGWWVPTDQINSERYPAYHRLDLAFFSRYNYDDWSLNIYLSIQNLYNRQNIAFYQYNSDGTTDNVYQFSFLPVAGVEVQF